MYTCSMWSEKNCKTGKLENLPLNCPCNEKEAQEKIKKLYHEEENYKLAYNSALVEAEGYCQKTRLEEARIGLLCRIKQRSKNTLFNIKK